MKAVRFHEFGGPEVLRYEDVEQPTPAAGQVRIRVAATSFNTVDSDIRAGHQQQMIPVRLPHTLGVDVSGTIDALGPDVDELAVGDQVVGFLPMTSAGASAQYVIAPADALTGAPKHRSLIDLAALPLAGLTAWQALFDHGQVTAGQRVLINGVSEAVGGYAVQLAREAGAQVQSTAMSGPVDLVLNCAPVARSQLCSMLTPIRDGGKLINTTSRTPAPSDEKRGVRGIDLVVRSDIDQLADLVARVSTGELLLDVAQRITLADLPALHAQAESMPLLGKAVVVVRSDGAPSIRPRCVVTSPCRSRPARARD